MTAAQIAELAGYANEFSQRFGQFIHNIVQSPVGDRAHIDIFYVEDDELIRWARDYYNTYKKP